MAMLAYSCKRVARSTTTSSLHFLTALRAKDLDTLPSTLTPRRSEDRLQSLLTQSDSAELANRPGYGTRGRPIVLWANYFQLEADGNTVLYRYNVNVRSEQENRTVPIKLIKRILQLCIEEQLSSAGHDVVSDFRSTFSSRSQLALPEEGYTVIHRSEGEDKPAQNAKTYVVHVQHTGTLPLSTLLNYTTTVDVSSLFGAKQELIQALNLLVGHRPKSDANTFTVGKNRYVSSTTGATDRASLEAGLEVLRAFVFSVRAATECLLVNVQVKNLPFYDPGPLEQVARPFVSHNGSSRYALATFLNRLSVEVTHLRRASTKGQRNPRYKTISGLAARTDGRDLQNPPVVPSFGAGPKDVQFFLQDESSTSSTKGQSKAGAWKGKKDKVGGTGIEGRYISVFDFSVSVRFRSPSVWYNSPSNVLLGHSITIIDTGLPVVNVGNAENPSYLPLQVCEVRPGQAARGKISPTQTQQMIRFAVRRPAQNASSIVTLGLGLLGVEAGNPYLVCSSSSAEPLILNINTSSRTHSESPSTPE